MLHAHGDAHKTRAPGEVVFQKTYPNENVPTFCVQVEAFLKVRIGCDPTVEGSICEGSVSGWINVQEDKTRVYCTWMCGGTAFVLRRRLGSGRSRLYFERRLKQIFSVFAVSDSLVHRQSDLALPKCSAAPCCIILHLASALT